MMRACSKKKKKSVFFKKNAPNNMASSPYQMSVPLPSVQREGSPPLFAARTAGFTAGEDQPIGGFRNRKARWQFQNLVNVILGAFVVALALATTIQYGMWTRIDGGFLMSARSNLTAASSVRSLLLGVDVPSVPADRESIVGQLEIRNSHSSSNDAPVASLRALNKAVGGYRNGRDGHLALYTASNGTLAKAIHIDQQQRVGVNTSLPAHTLHVHGTIASTEAFLNLCDRRSKYDIAPLTATSTRSSLTDVVEAKQFRRYDSVNSSQVFAGLIAQDLEEAGATLATVNVDGVLHIDTMGLIAYLWEEVRFLNARLKVLEQPTPL